jgi:Flp pilus assembly protein TadG
MSMHHKITTRREGSLRRETGQSLVEVALMLPLLLLLLVGVIEIGRYAYIGILVGNAARAGAAYGVQGNIQSSDQVGITAAAKNDFQNNGQNATLLTVDAPVLVCGCDSAGTVTTAGCTTQINATAGQCTTGHWVATLTVTAHGKFSSLFGFPGIPNSLTISRSATIRVNVLG